MDFEQARFNMVEQQIRTWDVLDQRVLDLLFEVRREDFVPAAYRTLAFADLEIPLGEDACGRETRGTRRADYRLDHNDAVLEVGTGSGYLTALLARSSAAVTSVEIIARFSADAAGKLARAGIVNARLEVGDCARGWGNLQYDMIVLTGSTPVLPGRGCSTAAGWPAIRRRRRSSGDRTPDPLDGAGRICDRGLRDDRAFAQCRATGALRV